MTPPMARRTSSPALRDLLEVQAGFDPAAEARRRVGFLADYLRASGQKRLLVGVSGGVDSALAGRLAVLAVERLREAGRSDCAAVAIRLPCGVQQDEEDACRALAWIRPTTVVTVDIEPAVRLLDRAIGDAVPAQWPPGTEIDRDFVRGNTKARMRMAVQYHLAGLGGGLVVGTDHAAEALVGFFTKFGDGAADVIPLFGLTKRRVRALAAHLGAPPETVAKEPTADLEDLRPGLPDEEALGVTYAALDDYLEGRPVPEAVALRIERLHRGTEHKRRGPVTPGDRWWRAE